MESHAKHVVNEAITHLIRVGKIQRVSPSCAGCASKLPLGSSIYTDNQTSPRTFAKEVKTSANTTSEKYTPCGDGNKHLWIALANGKEKAASARV